MLGLKLGKGCLTTYERGLYGRQPVLRASQRRLGSGKATFASSEHHFRHRNKVGRVTGKLLYRSQGPACQTTNVTLVPGREIIAHEQGQYAHRHPVQRFFGTHRTAPQSVMWVRRTIPKFVIHFSAVLCTKAQAIRFQKARPPHNMGRTMKSQWSVASSRFSV